MPPLTRKGAHKAKSVGDAILASNPDDNPLSGINIPYNEITRSLARMALYLELSGAPAVKAWLTSDEFAPFYNRLYTEAIELKKKLDKYAKGPDF